MIMRINSLWKPLLVLAAASLMAGCATTKTVTITTVPENATVSIGGAAAVPGPVKQKLTFNPSSATIEATAHLDGYQDGSIQIAYEPPKQMEYIIQLSRFQKTVQIESEPAGATVSTNGQSVGVTPLTTELTFADATKPITVRLQKEGYMDGSVQIAYSPASQTEYNIQLNYFQKTVQIESEPAGATVFTNDQLAGITPLTTELTFADETKPITVRLQKDGYKDGTNTIAYAPTNQTDYSVTLEKNETVPITLVSIEPKKTDNGVKLALTSRSTLAYLEVIERSPNVASVTKVTGNQDKGVNIGPPVLSPTSDEVLFTEIVTNGDGSWYSNIQKERVGSFAKTRLTYGNWQDAFPAFTADGSNVVFSSNRASTNNTLWLVSADSPGGLTKLTYTEAADYSPSVAPDNRTIAYTSIPPNAEEPQIWSLSRDNNLLTQLREGESPQVSPDGKRILFVRQIKNSDKGNGPLHQLWIMSIDGANETQLTQNTDYDVIDPRWSPDGKWIVYASNEGYDSHNRQNYDIWLMKADGSQPTQLTTNGSRDDSPCWDHEGKTIYFRSNRGGAWNIWRFQPILSAE
jgi:Tol biopolymer transport system component